jgi:hypothetical protein
VVNLAAAALAQLRADHAVAGAAVAVAEGALRNAVCGALLAGEKRRIDVRVLDAGAVEQSSTFAKLNETASQALALKRRLAAVTLAAEMCEIEAKRLEAQRDALWEQRWGSAAAGAAQPAGLENQLAWLEAQVRSRRGEQLRCALLAKQAAVLAEAFDAAVAAMTAGTAEQPAPIVLAALRRAVAATPADYLLQVSLYAAGGALTAKSKSLLARGGDLALNGHVAAGYLLVDRKQGLVAAAGTVGAAASMKHAAGNAKFGEWAHTRF